MADRYPGYDVLAKRHTPSWDRKTRDVIDERLAVPREPRFLNADEFATVEAIAARIVPQGGPVPAIPVAALVDDKLVKGKGDGFRQPGMPRGGEAWRHGLRALDAEAQAAHDRPFRHLHPDQQDDLLRKMQDGALKNPEWGEMKPKTFFKQRMAHDIVFAYYSHPTSWNEIGFGGPASPRGYVRTGYDERDPWEAVQAPAARNAERPHD